MEPTVSPTEDPLVAALPPKTDYITYLTILEYQLKTSNLPTLNRLLTEDDGTLASEIGWDLLKLVLPMLQVVPEEANKCFALIARRGNPREVVIRVAEELQRLGQHDASEDDLEDDLEDDQEELPTFAGEAARVHLGNMKLDGMPETSQIEEGKKLSVQGDQPSDEDAQSGSDDVLSLQALMSILAVVHPRIKTQYPSRFLATSLPAALGAYRRLPVTNSTTHSFLDLLSKLSGKQRPILPPRTSTSGSAASLLVKTTTDPMSTAPLPDPETKTDQPQASSVIQNNEKDIIRKLLQAVLLEVLDEYANSLLATDVVTMQWTTRLREKTEPKRVVPRRETALDRWKNHSDLHEREQLLRRFLTLAKDLSLNVFETLRDQLRPHQSTKDEEVSEEESEYPQSPSDIPFPLTGLLILNAAERFYMSTQTSIISINEAVGLLCNPMSFAMSETAVVIDAVLSLVYKSVSDQNDQLAGSDISQSSVEKSIRELTSVFTTSPEPLTRDNAHHIATMIFQGHADVPTKISLIKSLLKTKPTDANALTAIQSGNLRSVAADWLKDSCLWSLKSPISQITSNSNQPIAIDVTTFQTDNELASLIFPALPTIPGPFISSHEPGQSSEPSMSSEQDLESFLLQIPFYISSLNLITILGSITVHQEHEDTGTTSKISEENGENSIFTYSPELLSKATAFIDTLATWQEGLQALLMAAKSNRDDKSSPVTMSDLYSLEDGVNRAKAALQPHHET